MRIMWLGRWLITHLHIVQRLRMSGAQLHYVGPELRYIFWPPGALSEDLCRKVVVRLQEVVRQNGGHIEHVLH